MRKLMTLAIVLVVGWVLAGGAAADTAIKAEVVAKCKQAAQMYKESGSEAALAEINNKSGAFVSDNTYVFAINLQEGKVIAHPIKPALIGKTLVGLKDIKGKMFFNEFIKVGKDQGEGWVDYMWPKPGDKKPSPKTTYVYRVEGEAVAVLAGTYEVQ